MCKFPVYQSKYVNGQVDRVVCPRGGQITWNADKHSFRPRLEIHVKVLAVIADRVGHAIVDELSLSPLTGWSV